MKLLRRMIMMCRVIVDFVVVAVVVECALCLPSQ